MRWSEFYDDAPGLGALFKDRLIRPGVLLVVSLRHDGTPRLSPVEPFVLDGELWLSMMWESRKAADLYRDPRVLLHSIVTKRDGGDGEAKLRGKAMPVHDATSRARYADAVSVLGWQPTEPWFHLIRMDVSDATYVWYAESGDQHVARWPERREYVRRATSATSVGDPETESVFFPDFS